MIDVLNEMKWYSIQFLGDLGAWLVTNPYMLIFITLGIVAACFSIVRKLVG